MDRIIEDIATRVAEVALRDRVDKGAEVKLDIQDSDLVPKTDFGSSSVLIKTGRSEEDPIRITVNSPVLSVGEGADVVDIETDDIDR